MSITTMMPTSASELNTTDVNDSFNNITFNSTPSVSSTFTALLLIFALPLNCIVIAIIAQSKTLRTTTLNQHIISLSCVNLLECILNLPIALTTLVTGKWLYGESLCLIHSYILTLTQIVPAIGIMCFLWDRFVHIYSSSISPKKTVLIILYTWIHACFAPIPVLVALIDASPYPFVCPQRAKWTEYAVIMTILSIIIPFGICLLVCVIILVKTLKNIIKNRKENEERPSHLQMDRQISVESQAAILSINNPELHSGYYACLLFLFYSILQLPYVCVSFQNQVNFNRVKDETLFTVLLMRQLYILAHPLCTIVMRKIVWQKIKNFILCRKSNLVVDGPSSKENELAKMAYNIPVLFATAEGLHVHQNTGRDSSVSDLDETLKDDEDVTARNVQLVHATKCDVMQSQEFFNEDTSDYDSSGEAFASSNPISVRGIDTPKLVTDDEVVADVVVISPHGDLEEHVVSDSHHEDKQFVASKTLVETDPFSSGIGADIAPEIPESDKVHTLEADKADPEVAETKQENDLVTKDPELESSHIVDDKRRKKRRRRVGNSSSETDNKDDEITKIENNNSYLGSRKASVNESSDQTITNDDQNISRLKALKQKIISETRNLKGTRRIRRVSSSDRLDTTETAVESFKGPSPNVKRSRKKKKKESIGSLDKADIPKPPPRLSPLESKRSEAVFDRSVIPDIPPTNANNSTVADTTKPARADGRPPRPTKRHRTTTSQSDQSLLNGSNTSQELSQSFKNVNGKLNVEEHVGDLTDDLRSNQTNRKPQRQISESCQDLLDNRHENA